MLDKNISVDVSYKSLNKFQEELCGDHVEIVNTKDSMILILADGMGSGVKANILSTLTAKILATMLEKGAKLEDCVETISQTLPICQVRHVAYSTFSILQIFNNGRAYLVEFDNPSCIFIRKDKIMDIDFQTRIIEGKEIKEAHFEVELNDTFILMSDGAIYAGVGQILNFGWTRESIAEYALSVMNKEQSSSRLAADISEACNDLYMSMPGDDTTIAVCKIIRRRVVHIFTGPPYFKEDDARLIKDFMTGHALRIVSGGTSANITSRELHQEITTELTYVDPEIPPIAYIRGIDLVTEGVITLSRTLTLLKEYAKGDIGYDFFRELDKKNGASMIAKMLIENCTECKLFVGKAINIAHQNPNLPFDLSIRMNVIEQIKETMEHIGKKVEIIYY